MRKRVRLVLSMAMTIVLLVGLNASFAGTTGAVLLGGGSIEMGTDPADRNDAVWEALRDSTGLSNPTVAVFCSGAADMAAAEDAYYNDAPPTYLSWEHLFQAYGMNPVFIPITIENYQTAAYDQSLVATVENADIVWFNGGDQSRHARALLKDDGSDTPLMAAVRTAQANGATIGGSSAGAAIQGALTYGEGDSYGYLEANGMVHKSVADGTLADPNDPYNGGYMTGFGFTADLDMVVDTHVDSRGRLGRMVVAGRDLSADLVVGVYENSAVLIDNGVGSVVGARGAAVVDSRGASYTGATYFEAFDVEVYSLSAGDQIDFTTMTVNATGNLITKEAYRKARDSRDIFGEDNFIALMERLVDSRESMATGTTYYSGPEFILDFSKDGYTNGYYNNGMYTVENMILDVSY